MEFDFFKRTRFILIIISIIVLIIIGRLYYIQVLNGDIYISKADKQYIKPNQKGYDRGSIFFTLKNGDKIAVATIKQSYNLSINPKNIQNVDQVYEALSQYIDIDEKVFREKAGDKSLQYYELVKKLDTATGQSIASLRLPGVSSIVDNGRVYPANNLSSHTIGIIGFDKNNNLAGRYGLESFYDNILSRKSAGNNINFFAEVFSDLRKTVLNDDYVEGDIVSSIEPTVASYLEKTLEETKSKWKSDSIGGIIMDPNTGEIYAMSKFPDFNPNDLSNIKDAGIFSNNLVESSYEMGSIIKPLTMAIGIDSGAITTKTTYNDEGSLNLSGRKISNYDGKSKGITSMQTVLSQSLNVGAATIALKTGPEKFSEYFLNLGFGEKTGIDQPNEQKGLIKNLLTGRDVEVATASYGQGISMTPIQTITALATLANGGDLIVPHIIKSIEHTNGESVVTEIKKQKIFEEESVKDVTNMLINVVDTALKKGEVKMEHYSIAAKTGTAQIADPVNGGYYKDRYLHSFFGYFPAYNPKFIVLLYHIHPKGAEYSSETLTDPFIQLTKLLINYYEIPPDR